MTHHTRCQPVGNLFKPVTALPINWREGYKNVSLPPLHVTGPDMTLAILTELESGNARAEFCNALGRSLLTFFTAFTPDDFRRAAEVLKKIARDPLCTERSQIRAIRALFRPLRDAVSTVTLLMKAGDEPGLEHVFRLITAYLRAFTPDEMREVSAHLARKCNDNYVDGAAAMNAIRASETLFGLLAQSTTMLTKLGSLRIDRNPKPKLVVSNAEADAELAEMEQEILASEESDDAE